MFFDSTNPVTSRDRFKTRAITNMAVLGVGFVGIVFLWSVLVTLAGFGFLACLAGDAVALGAVYFLFTLWEKRPVRIRCLKCDKIIMSNTPWVCGVCGTKNTNVDEYPFVHRCEHCSAEPKAYCCHHVNEDKTPCETLVYLSEDRQPNNFARAIAGRPDAAIREEDSAAARRRAEEKLEKEHIYKMAELDAELNKILARAEKPKMKSPQEQAQEACEREYQGIMGIREYALKKEREIEEALKDDPSLLRAAKKAIKDIVRRISP